MAVGVNQAHLLYRCQSIKTKSVSFTTKKIEKLIKAKILYLKIRYYSIWCLMLLSLLLLSVLSGCQKEFENITPPSDDKAIPANSALAQQLQNVALNDGSLDNIIDRSSCMELVLPVTVVANGQELEINTADDFELVERIFDEDQNDQDVVIINFPVTVILADHTELTIDNQEELNDLTDECDNGPDDDIECLDFKYPLTFSLYDPVNQVADIVTINDDKSLFRFFDELDDSQFAGFTFPVTMVLSDEEEITINDNNELRNALKDFGDDCDEDDDNDFNDDDVDDTEFVGVLIDGVWKITTFFDSADKLKTFEDFVFTFNADGTVSATDGVTTVFGVWEGYGGDGKLELQLNFGDEKPFDEISRDWQMVNYSSTVIRLRNRDVQNDSVSRLVFEKI